MESAGIEAGLSLKEIAEKLNRAQSYISEIESGQLRVRVIQLKELEEL